MAIEGHRDDSKPLPRPCIQSNFVQPDEFLKLLLSRRVLIRSDATDGSVRGLLDPNTGRRFIVEQAAVASWLTLASREQWSDRPKTVTMRANSPKLGNC